MIIITFQNFSLSNNNLIFSSQNLAIECVITLFKWQPTLVFLPEKSQGWRSLVGYSPGGRKELDTTK